jgi:phosphoribosylglycinamide formyltransferase 2
MNREGIRRLAAEELDLPTSPYHFADTFEDYSKAVQDLGFPCVVKPVMSSSGKGQSLLRSVDDVQKPGTTPRKAAAPARPGDHRRLHRLRLRNHPADRAPRRRHHLLRAGRPSSGEGRYQEQAMSPIALAESERGQGGDRCLGGRGLFGVELFIKGDQVWFSEVSPRPHDTGLVT